MNKKRLVNRVLKPFGYKLARRDAPVSPQQLMINLSHMANAYEELLNARNADAPIPADALRLRLLGRLLGIPLGEAYAIVQALHRTRSVDGDVCEFGVAQGATSALIANEIRNSAKTFHLFDSFEGLPAPTEEDQLQDDFDARGRIEAYAGTMACPESMVIGRLADIEFPPARYRLHKGRVEDVIRTDGTLPRRVAFAYVDFDFYAPIKVALEYLHPITPAGAIVIVDDYGFFSSGAKTAVDEFVRATPGYAVDVPPQRVGYCAILTKRTA